VFDQSEHDQGPIYIIILSKLLFSGFLRFKSGFARGQNNSKYRD